MTNVLEPEDYPLELCVSPSLLSRRSCPDPEQLVLTRLTHSDTRALTFHGPVPIRISVAGRAFLLDTDHYVRRTTLTPPSAASSSEGTAQQAAPLPPLIQERWHSLTRDGTRGVDVYQPVARGLVDEVRRAGTWRTGLEEVERRCAAARVLDAVPSSASTLLAGAHSAQPGSGGFGTLAGQADGSGGRHQLFARASRPSSPLV